jgi:hypothetical protein
MFWIAGAQGGNNKIKAQIMCGSNAAGADKGGTLYFATNAGGSSATSPATRMVITSSGSVGIGTESPTYTLEVLGTTLLSNSTNSNKLNIAGFGDALGNGIRFDPAVMTSARPLIFYNTSTAIIGSITHPTTTTTAYNTSSDYRMKENVVCMTGGLGRIQSLKPCVFTWKEDGSLGEGFLAHELADVVPLAVTGQKDAVDETGQINPQQVDMAKVVPILVAAVQELKGIVDAQAAEIEQLKAR